MSVPSSTGGARMLPRTRPFSAPDSEASAPNVAGSLRAAAGELPVQQGDSARQPELEVQQQQQQAQVYPTAATLLTLTTGTGTPEAQAAAAKREVDEINRKLRHNGATILVLAVDETDKKVFLAALFKTTIDLLDDLRLPTAVDGVSFFSWEIMPGIRVDLIDVPALDGKVEVGTGIQDGVALKAMMEFCSDTHVYGRPIQAIAYIFPAPRPDLLSPEALDALSSLKDNFPIVPAAAVSTSTSTSINSTPSAPASTTTSPPRAPLLAHALANIGFISTNWHVYQSPTATPQHRNDLRASVDCEAKLEQWLRERHVDPPRNVCVRRWDGTSPGADFVLGILLLGAMKAIPESYVEAMKAKWPPYGVSVWEGMREPRTWSEVMGQREGKQMEGKQVEGKQRKGKGVEKRWAGEGRSWMRILEVCLLVAVGMGALWCWWPVGSAVFGKDGAGESGLVACDECVKAWRAVPEGVKRKDKMLWACDKVCGGDGMIGLGSDPELDGKFPLPGNPPLLRSSGWRKKIQDEWGIPLFVDGEEPLGGERAAERGREEPVRPSSGRSPCKSLWCEVFDFRRPEWWADMGFWHVFWITLVTWLLWYYTGVVVD